MKRFTGRSAAVAPISMVPTPRPPTLEASSTYPHITADENGVAVFEAEFFTSNSVIRGTTVSPENRLSDVLNGSVPVVEGRFIHMPMTSTTQVEEPKAALGDLTKASILFAVPQAEPKRPEGISNPAWKPVVPHRCRVIIGSYQIEGIVYLDPSHPPLVALRANSRRFIPLVRATVHAPDGSEEWYPTVIINRERADLFELKS